MEATAESEAAARGARAARPMAFELKGVMTSLAVMRLATEDLAAIEKQLRVKVAQLPQFFQDAPVVLDLGAAPDGGATVPLAGLVRMLRGFRLIPVGVTNAGDLARAVAVGLGLGVMPYRAAAGEKNGRAATAPAAANVSLEPVAPNRAELSGEVTPPPEPRLSEAQAAGRPLASAASPNHYAAAGRARIAAAAVAAVRKARGLPPQAAAPTPTPAASIAAPRPPSGMPAAPSTMPGAAAQMVVRAPVRAGQVIYARNSDLLVLAPVNPGAEVIADGNVHIYSTLRGRAVAGAQGDVNARIFCQRLQAELVAVAGAYIMAEDIPREARGQAVQVHMEGGECRITAL